MRRDWARKAFPHMARDEDLSLATVAKALNPVLRFGCLASIANPRGGHKMAQYSGIKAALDKPKPLGL